ncbi:glycosyltransferase [Flaviflexus equikiangi]|uniref:glycosyltransferase n=1 Tax=Flaviflexus equikiangi TaxID=2758573 RepID=UPI001C716338|nr:glycosyltransferase [Flaviflexus equikiangi]
MLKQNYDAVIFLGDWKYLSTWIGQIIVRLRGRKSFLWTIGWHRPETGFKSFLRKTFYNLSHKLLLYGVDGRDIGCRSGFSAKKMAVVGNSHDIKANPQLNSESFPYSENCLRVGAVIRLQESRRFDLLFHAVKKIKNRGIGCQIVLVGEGPVRQELQELSDQMDLRVEFLGAVYDPIELQSIYKELHLTVIPEAAGLTVINSLSHGVPVITSRDPFVQGPEFRAVIDGMTGSLYDPRNIVDLEAKILKWKDRFDSNGRVEYAESCLREISVNWTGDVHAERIANAILSA